MKNKLNQIWKLQHILFKLTSEDKVDEIEIATSFSHNILRDNFDRFSLDYEVERECNSRLDSITSLTIDINLDEVNIAYLRYDTLDVLVEYNSPNFDILYDSSAKELTFRVGDLDIYIRHKDIDFDIESI